MASRKGGANPIAKRLGRIIEKAGGEVIDGVIEMGSGKGGSKQPGSSSKNTDWATRTESAPRKRRSK